MKLEGEKIIRPVDLLSKIDGTAKKGVHTDGINGRVWTKIFEVYSKSAHSLEKSITIDGRQMC